MDPRKDNIQSILFIDAGVADAAVLAAGAADNVRVVMLAAGADGVRQIADVLSQYSGLDSIQIVSHGAAGRIQLGTAALDAASMEHYADALAAWGAALRDGGDLLLYGCDVARGADGMAFVDALADASGADVAASTNTTGAGALGGDWLLEYGHGVIEAQAAISESARQAYAGELPLVNNGANGTFTFTTSSDVVLLNATGLAAGAVVHVDNILGLGLDLYTQSALGGGVVVLNANGNSLIGLPLTDDRLTVNGSLLSPVNYVDLRANSGVFDMVSLKLGSGNLVGNLLGTVIYTVYALDANYQPTGVGVSLLSLVINEYGLLNFDSMANFKGIYGVRIVNPLGFEVGIDDVTIANARVANSVTSAAYNAGTGVLNITATGIQTGDTIDPGKFTITGQGGATYTLTSPTVAAASGTLVSVTLNAADKLALNGLLNNNGAAGVDGTAFNLAAAANWDANKSNGVDLTGNAIVVSNVQLPTITSATYDAATRVLTVTGNNLVSVTGAANDITVAKLTLTGQDGATRVLSTSSNVEVTSATSFAVTLSGADVAAVAALTTRNGTAAASGTSYTLAAADDWNSVIGNTSIAVGGVGVTVSNVANSAPVISGAAAAGVADNATLQPFGAVSVTDFNGDNVSMSIAYTAANGTLSGAGLSGGAGAYTLSATSPAALTAQLRALVFTPTANQVAPGATVATTFTLTPTDSQGLAGGANTATVITATSINDAPVLGGATAGQSVAAGATVAPFGAFTVADADIGATVSITVAPDSAAKGVFTSASLIASGFTTSNGGASYTHAAVSPAAAQAALRALVFQSASGGGTTTTFTVGVNDGAASASNSATTVVSTGVSTTTVLGVAFSSDSGISASDLVTNVAAQTISGTLSANLAAGESVQVSLDNGATWSTATATAGTSTWLLAGQTLTGSSILQARVVNLGGNGAAFSAAYTLDTSAPTNGAASFAFSNDSGVAGDLVTNSAAQTVSGTLTGALAAGEHVEVSLNNGASWTTASAVVGATGWSLAGQTLAGSNTLQVRVVDAAGNTGAAAGTAYVLDTTAPTAAMSSSLAVLKSGDAATVTVTFSEAPVGLALGDFTAVNGTIGNLTATANPLVYTLQFVPTPGLIGLLGGVSLAAGSYTDLAGNSGGGAAALGLAITTVGPGVLVTSDSLALKAGDTAQLTFTFTSAPTGFTSADINATGGTVGALTATANPLVYTAVFTPAAGYTGAASVTVTGGSYTDGVGNPGGAGVSTAILVDTQAPTVAITSDVAAVHSGTSAAITFTFSEAPLGFTAADVVVTGGALSGFTPTLNPLVYTAVFTPDAGIASGSAGITVTGGSYTDLAGNTGVAGGSPTIAIDTLAPATTAGGVAFSNDSGASTTDLVTNSAAQTISGTLGAPLAGDETVQVSLDHGQTWSNATAAAGASAWTLAGVTLAGSDTLQVRVVDGVGNAGAVFSAAYVLDTAAPTAFIGSNLAVLKSGDAATITVTFSEAPSGLDIGDFSAVKGTLGNLTATANPLVYTVQFVPEPGLTGALGGVSLNAGGYTDLAGNAGGGASALALSITTLGPGVLVTSDSAALKTGETAQLTFTFTSAPSGFTAADITATGGAVTGLAASADPLVYHALFTPAAGYSGAAAVTVTGGSYTDSLGNAGGAGVSAAILVDTQAPTLIIGSDVSAVHSGTSAAISFTFSEAPLGFTVGDVGVTGGMLSGFGPTANPLVYTAVFTPDAGVAGANASITVAGGSYTDFAGNAGVAGGSPAIAIDTLAPAVTATGVAFSNDGGASSTDLVTNSAAQTVSGTLGAPLAADETVQVSLDHGQTWFNATAAPGASAWTLPGVILAGSDTLQVRVVDGVGNTGNVFSAAYVLDTTAPTATMSSDLASLKSGDTATITVTFSEAPTGFDIGDLTAVNGTIGTLAATADPLVYTVQFAPNPGLTGAVGGVTLTAGGYTDLAGNGGGGATATGLAITTVGPGVVIAADRAALRTGDTAQLSFTFSSAPSGFTDADINASGGTVSGLAATANPLVYSALFTPAAGYTGAASVTVTGGSYTDVPGNAGGAGVSPAIAVDTQAPTLAITSDVAAVRSGTSAAISFTFSEAPLGFTASDVAVTGGTLSGFAPTLNPLVYTAVFTPDAGVAGANASITVAGGSYTDLAGNAGTTGGSPAIAIDTVAPVTVTSGVTFSNDGGASTTDLVTNSAAQTINGTLGTPLAGDETVQVSLDHGQTWSNAAAAAGATGWTLAGVTLAGSDTLQVRVLDAAGNSGAVFSAAYVLDTTAPTATMDSSLASLKSGDTATITITFSEAPSGFDSGDLKAVNGTLGALTATANPLVYTVQFTPDPGLTGAVGGVTLAAGGYTDLAGNAGGAAAAPSLAVTTVGPGVLVSSDSLALKTGDTAQLTFTFSGAPSGFTASDITATGGTVSGLAASADPLVYHAVFTPAAGYTGAAAVTVAGGSYTDVPGNPGGAGVSPAIAVDTQAPTLAITSDVAAVRSGTSATVSFTFSEAPLGFTAGDVGVSGGALSGFAPTLNPLVYTAVFTPDAGIASGSASITVAGGSYTDLAGNAGTAGGSPTIAIDTVAPAAAGIGVTFSNDGGASSTDLVTRNAAQTISGTLGAPLQSGDVVRVSLDHGQTWSNAAANIGATGWTLAGATLAGSDTLQVRVVDAAGNAGALFAAAYVLDTSAPSAILSSDLGTLKSGDAATITITFSEAPYGFAINDLTAVNGTLGTLAATADPLVYTVQFVPTPGLTGQFGGVTLAAGGYTDLAGNAGAGAAAAGLAITTIGPGVLVTSDSAALKGGDTAQLTFTFSSAPVGFTSTDIVATGGNVSGLAASANPLVYHALFTPTAGFNGAASVAVTGGSYTDVPGNPGGAGVSAAILVDTQAPGLTITSDVAAVRSGTAANISFTFSEAPLGFTADDVGVTGGTLSGFAITANPLVYKAVFTPAAGIASGNAGITVAGGSYTDLAGNAGTAGGSPAIAIDTVAPTVVTTGVAFSSDTGASPTDLVTRVAAQTVTGNLGAPLAAGETVQVSLDHGQSWSNAAAATGDSAWTLAGATLAGANTLQVRVLDAAGNTGAVFSTAYVLDATAPTVAVASDLAALGAGQVAHVTFTFSEAPQGFSGTSLAVAGGVVTGLAASANPLVYTALFTPTAGQSGASASVGVIAGGYTDLAGNAGAAVTSAPIVVNTAAPSLLIGSSALVMKGGDTAQISFTFSSAPVGFTSSDVSVGNGALSGFAATANPLVYTALFTPAAGVNGGTAAIAVAAGSYTDVHGNSGGAGNGPAIALDTAAPTVAIATSTAQLKAGDTATITFTFSEVPFGFTAGDVAATGGTLSGLTPTANPLIYTAIFTPTPGTQGVTATVGVGHGAFTDLAGNANGAAAPMTPTLAIDTLAPTATGASLAFSADTGTPGDLLTSVAAQTITGTLSAAPGAGEAVEVSLDNGASWTRATLGVGGSWALAGQTLAAGNGAPTAVQVRVTDAAGNHGPVASTAYVLDTTAPSAAIAADAAALKAGETATVTITFSEAPSGFTAASLAVAGGTLSGLAAGANALVYTALFTPTPGVNGAVAGITLLAGGYADAAGNPGAGAAMAAIAVDTLAPTTTGAAVVFSADSGVVGDRVTNIASQNLSGTLSAPLAAGETVQVSLDHGVSWSAAVAVAGNAGWTLAGRVLSAGAGQEVRVRVLDAAGNHGAAFSAAYTLDQTAPTLQIASDLAVLNSADTATITFTFSEAPVGFGAGAVGVGGGILSGFSASANPLVYTAVFTPTPGQAAGIGAVTVAPGSYTDAAGNSGAGAALPAISYATVAPGVAISSDVAALKAGQTATISFKFSAVPVDFTAADISVAGGSLGPLTASANPLIYTAVFTPQAGLAAGSAAIAVAAGSYQDIDANPGTAGTMPALAIDTVAPTVHIASNAALLGAGGGAVISFTFSEAPAAFSLAGVSATNGTLSNLAPTADPLIYTAVFTPAANVAAGSAVITVAPGAYADAAGNGGLAGASPAIAIDTVAPAIANGAVAFSADSGIAGDLVTNVAAQVISGTLAGTLGTGETVEVSLDNGASWRVAAAPDGVHWTLGGQVLTGAGTLRVRVSDAAGNHGAATSTPYALDTSAPQATLSADTAALRAGQSATIRLSFTEAPVGLTLSDLTATGGTLSSLAATADPLVYTVRLTPTPGAAASATVTLASGSYTDAAGNPGAGGVTTAISTDTVPPALLITSSAAALKVGETAVIHFVFSEAPVGFSLAAISAAHGSLSGLTASADLLSYTALYTPLPGTAATGAVIGVAAGAYADAAGNPGLAASATIVVDTDAPTIGGATVVFSADRGVSATDLVTNIAQQIIGGTLSGPLAAGDAVQVSLDNGATWLAAVGATGSPNWTLAPQILAASGAVQVRVVDAAGNRGPLFSASYLIDTTAPTMAVSSNAAALKAGESATLTFSFSEAPSGFALNDLVAVNGTLSNFTATTDPRVYTVLLTPAANLNGQSAGVTLAAGAYTDTAGNLGAAQSALLVSVDTAPPTLVIATGANNLVAGQQAALSFTFSEAPSGFGADDIVVTGGTVGGLAATADPRVYTAVFTPAPGVAGGSAAVTVAAGSYLDAAGNAGAAASSMAILYNTLPQATGGVTVSFSADSGVAGDLVTNHPQQFISGTLGANLAAGATVEVSLDGGQNWTAATTVGPNAWELGLRTLTGSGAVEVRIKDGAGVAGPVSSSPYVLDTAAPGVTLSAADAVLRGGQSTVITIAFSEAPLGFTQGDLVAVNGTLASFNATANPLVYTVVYTPTAGAIGGGGVSLAAGTYSDLAGNAGQAGALSSISVDALAPTVAVTSDSVSLKAGEQAHITFTFSETPVGFGIEDVSVGGGTLSGLAASANPLVYTALFTPLANSAGGAGIDVAAGGYSDAAGNGGLAASLAAPLAYDTQIPLAAAVAGGVRFSNDTGISATDLVTAAAAQTVSGTLTTFTTPGEVVEVSFDNGGSWQNAAVSGLDWSVAHTLTGSGVLRVRVTDAAGNHGAEVNTAYTYDVSRPSVAISSEAAIANGVAPVAITFTFSEAPASFGLADISVSGGTLAALARTSDPLVYTAQFTPAPGQNGGSASIVIAPGYTDVAGNSAAASVSLTLAVDTVAPRAEAAGVQLSSDSGVAGDLITNNPAQTVSGTLSAPLAAGEVVQVSLDNGANWDLATVSGTTWHLPGRVLVATGILMVRVADAAGNTSPAYTAQYTVDTVAPTVAISSSTGTLHSGQSALITITLSEPVALTLADITISGGTASGFSGSGTVYTLLLAAPADSTTPLVISVAGHQFTDVAGNPNTAATPVVLAVDTTHATPGVPSLVDGVPIKTYTGTDPRTGAATLDVSAPIVTGTRAEDSSTAHSNLADIPVGANLTVSLPLGLGFEAAGAALPLAGAMALTDLIGRIDDHTAAGQATQAAMEAQARLYLAGIGAAAPLQSATLTLNAGGTAAAGSSILIDGHAAGDAVALVIDAVALPAGVGLELWNVDFAAIIGAATVTGGAGQNFITGDGAAQHIVLTAGADDDTVYGNGGDDVLGTAGGNDHLDGGTGDDVLFAGAGDDTLSGGDGADVLQGGRSDTGQWDFYLNAAGVVVARHQMALTAAGQSEMLAAADINSAIPMLGFAGADAAHLRELSLLYHAAFHRAPDLAGLSYWAISGLTVEQIATDFLTQVEATTITGLSDLDNAGFVTQLLQNSVGRAPTAAELSTWTAVLDAAPGDLAMRADVFVRIALSAEHVAAWTALDGMALGGATLAQEQGWITGSGDDRLQGGAGSDLLVGGDGVDTVVYGGAAGGYGISLSAAGDVMIAEPDGGFDTIRQVERGEFNGATMDLGFTQAATATLQQLGMLYHLVLDRAGDISGFLYWLGSGWQGSALARGFTDSVEFQQRYGALDDDTFVRLMFQHTVGQDPDAAALARWDAYLDNHDRAEMVALMSTDATLVGSQMTGAGMSLIGAL